jgi:hypothetical protein
MLGQSSRRAAPAATCNIYLDPMACTLRCEGGSAVDTTICVLLFHYVALELIGVSTVLVKDEAQEV